MFPFKIIQNVDLLTFFFLCGVYNLLLVFFIYYESYTKHCTNDCSKSLQLNLKELQVKKKSQRKQSDICWCVFNF